MMAVLSKNQIEDLVALFDVWWNGEQSYRDYLTEWNDKQPTQQHASSDNSPKSPIGVSEMTMRDYFAAKAMQAEITEYSGIPTTTQEYLFEIAVNAYAMADTMLKIRDVEIE